MTDTSADSRSTIRADEHDIAALLVRYATGIDRRDWDAFRSCFADDVVAVYDGIATWLGVDEITAFMVDAHADMGHTMHRIMNPAIEVDGDTATARCYVDLVAMMPDGQTGVKTAGFYDDELVRTADGWRIARRHFVGVHMEGIGAS